MGQINSLIRGLFGMETTNNPNIIKQGELTFDASKVLKKHPSLKSTSNLELAYGEVVAEFKDRFGTIAWCNEKIEQSRELGHAWVDTIGYESWWKNNVLHRLDGPARVYSDGSKEYYVDGKQLSYEEFIALSYKDTTSEPVKQETTASFDYVSFLVSMPERVKDEANLLDIFKGVPQEVTDEVIEYAKQLYLTDRFGELSCYVAALRIVVTKYAIKQTQHTTLTNTANGNT